MTERPLGLEIGTQTPLPKTSLNFDLLRPMNGTANDNSAVAFAEQMKRNETILRDQIDALRKFEATKLGKKSLDAADEQCDSIEDGQSKPISVIFNIWWAIPLSMAFVVVTPCYSPSFH